MKHDHHAPQPRSQDEHSPIVIHHPEEDQTILERWVRENLAQGPILWAGLAGLVLIALGIAWFLSGSSGASGPTAEAWRKLSEAKSADQQYEVAEKYANTKAAGWAYLQAAASNFSDGVERLPTSLDAARPLLTKAQDQFEEALKAAPKGSIQARRASFGLARCLEVRNELDAAIKQYDSVAQNWPDTEEARQSAVCAVRLRAELKKPEAERFYTRLYAFKPSEATMPPGLTPGGDFGLPPLGGVPGSGGVNAGSILDSILNNPPPGGAIPDVLPPLPTPKAESKDKSDEPKGKDQEKAPTTEPAGGTAPTPAPTNPANPPQP